MLLIVLACADVVEQDLFDAELGNRDLQLSALEERLTSLEETVASQSTTIQAQADTITTQADTIASLEATVSTQGTSIAALETSNAELLVRIQDAENNHTDLAASVDDILLRVSDLEAQTTQISSDLLTLSTRVSLAESTVVLLSDDLSVLETDVADLEAVISGSGGTTENLWMDEGSGSGNCARANVTASKAGPLFVLATVEASHSMSGGCTDSTGSCYVGTSIPSTYLTTGSTVGSITINSENSAGTWINSISTVSSIYQEFSPSISSVWSNPYNHYSTSGYQSLSHDWTIPLQTVLDIPAAGDYIIDLDVTGVTGTCRLVVIQP